MCPTVQSRQASVEHPVGPRSGAQVLSRSSSAPLGPSHERSTARFIWVRCATGVWPERSALAKTSTQVGEYIEQEAPRTVPTVQCS